MQFEPDGFLKLTGEDYQEITDSYLEGGYLKRLLQLTQEPEREIDTEYDVAWALGDAMGIEDPEKCRRAGEAVRTFFLMVEHFCFCAGVECTVDWINAHRPES